ncbi:type 2 isopentenyl-diphosphate Delta-isomerase [Alicyclobacillus tolerans]|uniref:Isopentenyl-diphosphate delta-isomerase n=1 Tax=Alicyclobacillus tolerans TaxID=90970 RepID=A0A1M6NMJ3_9BACL|nr:type 2 isopentenyl-diphosphate Delta-isomerase [Alicyclobacillus montanus]SHJ96905.1 isopentenyl-diphosphate delta-isomerase [Alicyclobacillus montanus]
MLVHSDIRSRRKAEHLEAVKQLGDTGGSSWFEDISLLSNCAPELAWEDVALETHLCGIRLPSPILINAMTGGTEEAYEINKKLAAAARRHGLAMAVGSETAGLSNDRWARTYTVVREENPDGVVIANVGMNTDPDVAKRAVQLIGAQLLQVHWNVAQELFMPEGDRNFHGALVRLHQTVQSVGVPVIAKEVGQGIASEQAERFVAAGVSAIDVGGRGGTNFIAVEAWRRNHLLSDQWQQWGLPTPVTLCEVLGAVGGKIDVVASGGIRNGHDIAKSISLGASAVGIAGPFLRLLSQPEGEKALDAYIEELHWTLHALLVMTGSKNWHALRQRPIVIGGRVREWLSIRGLDKWVRRLGRRGQP